MRLPVAVIVLLVFAPGLSGCERPSPREQGVAVPTASPLATPAAVPKSDTLPAEVAAFAERRSQCDHFRDEEAYDADRGRFLAARLAELCSGTDTALAALKKRYAANRAAVAALADFEDKVE